MSLPDSLTLDQLRLFVSVADDGSFSAAARRYKRAQSAVSYGIANLETNLNLELFDRSGRKPVLTPTGQSLIHDARNILNSIHSFRSKASAIEEGLELEVSMAISAICPTHILIALATDFQKEFPTVPLRIQTEVMEDVAQKVVDGVSQIGITGPIEIHEENIEREFLTQVEMYPVVGANHCLAQHKKPVSKADLLKEVQIVIAHRDQKDNKPSINVISRKTWRVADVTTKRDLIEAGLGWGYLPLDSIQNQLKEKSIQKIHIKSKGAAPVRAELSCITNIKYPPGPATRWILHRLQEIGGKGRKATGKTKKSKS